MGFSFGYRKNFQNIEVKYNDPTIFPPDEINRDDFVVGVSYTFYFNFASGSYLLFSQMEDSSFHIPVSLTTQILKPKTVTLNPSLNLSYLLGRTGRVGIAQRFRLFTTFLDTTTIGIGGYETDPDINFIDVFMNGYGQALTIRGYAANVLQGKTAFYSNNEIRFHLLAINKGIGVFPFLMKNLQGAVFFDF